MTPVIKTEKLCKTFRGKRGTKVEALKSLNLKIYPGEVFGYLGPNGAGKSTTIKILTGQLAASGGDARILGIPAKEPASRKNVGYLPEHPALYEFLTAREYLRSVGQVYGLGKVEIESRSSEVLEKLDLQEAVDRRIRYFSKGMVQRLGLAQALLHDPDLYILDEPMSGLDPVGRALIKDIILELRRKGKTVFFSTHIIADVEAVCDRIGIIARGKLRAESLVQELLKKSTTGYRFSIEGKSLGTLSPFAETSPEGISKTFFVPFEKLEIFMKKVFETDCRILSMEPCRQSLERFFLKTIAGGGR